MFGFPVMHVSDCIFKANKVKELVWEQMNKIRGWQKVVVLKMYLEIDEEEETVYNSVHVVTPELTRLESKYFWASRIP